MSRHGRNWPGLLAISALLALGCGSGPRTGAAEPDYALLVEPSTVEPHDPLERAVLSALKKLPAEAESIIDGHKVITGAPYAAASGRTCRSIVIHVANAQRHRLACRMGDAWAYVPNAVRQPEGAP